MLCVRHRPERRPSLVLGGSPPSYSRVFVWSSVASATSYTLQVGTSTSASNVYNSAVGNLLTATLPLAAGTYYSRVQAYETSTCLSTLAEETFTVTA